MGPLDSMPVFIQAVVVAIVFAAITVGGLYLVRLKIAPDFLREDLTWRESRSASLGPSMESCWPS